MLKSTLALSTLLLASLGAPAVGSVVYSNTSNWTSSNGILTGSEWADDLHLTAGGDMSEFQFGYISNGATQATIRFYVNDAVNSILPVTGGEFHTEIVSIPGGGSSGLKTVSLASPVAVPEHLWMSIQFNGSSAAMPLYHPPTEGWSDSAMVIHVSSGWGGDVFGSGRNSFQFSITREDTSAWVDLGFGLAGTNGVPTLTGAGSLHAGTSYSLALANARQNATAFLVLGIAQINQPFAGGTLVPRVDSYLILPTDSAGELSIAGVVPGGVASGADLYVQYWIVDPAGPFGKAASNALRGTTP